MLTPYHLLVYVGGGTLGFLLVGGIFFPMNQVIALTVMGLSIAYLLSGVCVYKCWNFLYPE